MRDKAALSLELHGWIYSALMLRKALLAVLCLSTASLLAQAVKEPTFTEALVRTRSPLVLANGSLSGTGADVLSHAITSSRFVLLGEDHFSKEFLSLPQLCAT